MNRKGGSVKKPLLMLLALIGVFQSASAEEAPSLLFEGGTKALLVSMSEFAIVVSDQVTDGCLPSPTKLKDKMEIALRKNGFDIKKEAGYFTNDIGITALGYKIGESSCAVHLSVELLFQAVVNVPFSKNVQSGQETFAPFFYKVGSRMLTGPRYGMQARLEKQVTEYADELYLAISRAKDDVFSKFPTIKADIEKSKETGQ
jgi:hypothetical protein